MSDFGWYFGCLICEQAGQNVGLKRDICEGNSYFVHGDHKIYSIRHLEKKTVVMYDNVNPKNCMKMRVSLRFAIKSVPSCEFMYWYFAKDNIYLIKVYFVLLFRIFYLMSSKLTLTLVKYAITLKLYCLWHHIKDIFLNNCIFFFRCIMGTIIFHPKKCFF